jgi:hypothetical protein
MISQKEQKYLDLVEKRKHCNFCHALKNPSKYPKYDSAGIGPWSQWQNGLDAEILVVGQDWGDFKSFEKIRGREEEDNCINKNLQKLFRDALGISLENPASGKKNGRLFFTHSILCLKKRGLSASLEQKYAVDCCSKFLKPLIQCIEPKVVITLGKIAYESIVRSYTMQILPLNEAIESPDGFPIDRRSRLFPVYHCGKRGWNVIRKGDLQLEDWKKIRDYLASGKSA